MNIVRSLAASLSCDVRNSSTLDVPKSSSTTRVPWPVKSRTVGNSLSIMRTKRASGVSCLSYFSRASASSIGSLLHSFLRAAFSRRSFSSCSSGEIPKVATSPVSISSASCTMPKWRIKLRSSFSPRLYAMFGASVANLKLCITLFSRSPFFRLGILVTSARSSV